jgi:hypothetical protein
MRRGGMGKQQEAGVDIDSTGWADTMEVGAMRWGVYKALGAC